MRRVMLPVFVLLAVTIFGSWGYLVHRTVNQLAIYQLPSSLQSFFYSYKDELVYNAPRPDQRRGSDSTEGAKHFIDLEYYGDSAAWKLPLRWEDAVKVYPADTLIKYGYVPYHIVTIQHRLTEAFRSRNRDSILFYAADLGHYIADAHVPLHTSLNYDGQLTNQRGLHDLWETTVPEIEMEHYRLQSKHKARYIADPARAAWDIVRHTHSLLPDVFAKEKEVSSGFADSTKYRWQVRWGKNRRFYTSEFARAYAKALGNTINEQLLLSAQNVADFWYTAWVDAGRPDLGDINTKPVAKSVLKKEVKAYRKGKLREKGWLIAARPQSGD